MSTFHVCNMIDKLCLQYLPAALVWEYYKFIAVWHHMRMISEIFDL